MQLGFNQQGKTQLKSSSTICRSALYMPASNTRALEKATGLAADAIVMDLEDSVAPEAKAQARQNVRLALSEYDYAYRVKVLRVNDVSTPWFDEDMALLSDIQPDAVLLPKVEQVDAIARAHRVLDTVDSCGQVKLWAMLETTRAVSNAASIAQSAKQYPRFTTICIGNNDLAREAGMRVSSSREFLMPWLMMLLLAAKAQGLTILDGVYNDFRDTDGFESECEQGAAMGMDGKTLIHPMQIDPANKAFSPSESEINHAKQIVAEFEKPENAHAGVVQIDGKMVERLHLDMAQQTLLVAERIAEK